MELHEFVGARNNEDEMYARGATRDSGAVWDRCYEYDNLTCIVAIDNESASVTKDADGLACALDKSTAKFITRFAPARILAEVAAKRVVLRKRAKCVRDMRGMSQWNEQRWALEGTVRDLDEVLRAFAAAHSDHPDYNEEWKV